MARTRATRTAANKVAPSKSIEPAAAAASKHSLPAQSTNPPRVLILPNKATPEARVVFLENPRYSKSTRYLICPETGAYEFTKIAAPKATSRSWLIEGSVGKDEDDDRNTEKYEARGGFKTQVTNGSDLFVATPVDPLFLALPALQSQFSSTSKRMFLSSDDHFDTIFEETPHLRETMRWPKWRQTLESRMAFICDTLETGDEIMFRFSEEKLLNQLLLKAKKMSDAGLPSSMEEKFVAKALEAPVLGIKRMNLASTLQTQESTAPASQTHPSGEEAESQKSINTTTKALSEASTAETSMANSTESAIRASEEVISLQRLRVAFNFICSAYLPPSIVVVLNKMLADGKGYVDFAALDEYVAQLAKLRQEALLSRSASDYSRKRKMDEEDEERREKKRKKEEEEKRKKAGESRGVKELKKVNVSGMKKMSDFFRPKGTN